MYSLDNQIQQYTADDFSAEEAAQRFFALHGEADITKRLNEMSSVQQSIETVLRHKVRSNYGMFLMANEEIKKVDEEMSDLRQLIDRTQSLIEDVNRNRLAESRVMRSNSLLPALSVDAAGTAAESHLNLGNDENKFSMHTSAASAADGKQRRSAIPAWLSKAPEELAKFIVEQQFAKAVMVVLKTRAYVDSIKHTLEASKAALPASREQQGLEAYDENGANGGAKLEEEQASAADALEMAALRTAGEEYKNELISLVANVSERSIHLARAIRRTLLNLPSSQLWGESEQHKLLKLLIALEEFTMAADGFSITKVNAIRKVLRSVDPSGDAVAYAVELSQSFFGVLHDACISFQSLFEAHYAKPEIKNLLLGWIQKQIAVYVETLSRQIHAGISEIGALIIVQMRRVGVEGETADTSHFHVRSDATSHLHHDFYPQSVQNEEDVLAAGAGVQFDCALQDEADVLAEELYGRGALSFSSCCLDAAYSAAQQLLDHHPHDDKRQTNDSEYCNMSLFRPTVSDQQLRGSVCLGWMLIPELHKIVSTYADQFIEEVDSQVRQEEWAPVKLRSLSVCAPGQRFNLERVDGLTPQEADQNTPRSDACTFATIDTAPSMEASHSYAWLLTVLNHFCEESWILLQAQQQSSQQLQNVSEQSSPFSDLSQNILRDENEGKLQRRRSLARNASAQHMDFNSSMISLLTGGMTEPVNRSPNTTGRRKFAGPPLDTRLPSMEDMVPQTERQEIFLLQRQQYQQQQELMMSASYTRADVCEVEPTAVACIMRIVLRYVIELERTDTTGLTKAQLGCYLITVQALIDHLLPSMQQIIAQCFFTENVHQRSNSSSVVIKTLLPRLKRLARDKETERLIG